MKVWQNDDATLQPLKGKTAAILGYGNQGHAHALNLKDSGVEVRVGLRQGSESAAQAAAGGLQVTGIAEAAEWADVIMILTPDTRQADMYKESIAPHLKAGDTLMGAAAWTTHYSSWAAAAGLGSKISAFVDGAANMIMTLGIPKQFTLAIMAVFVASFAGTTLDTATRIQRYVVGELGNSINLPALNNRWVGTAIAVGTALVLAFVTGADGKGALKLWPLFGAVNQTLAALALIIITLYLKARGGLKWMVAGLPAIFMSVMTIWAVIMNQVKFGAAHNPLLQVINIIILFIAVWIAVEGVVKFFTMGGEVPPEPVPLAP